MKNLLTFSIILENRNGIIRRPSRRETNTIFGRKFGKKRGDFFFLKKFTNTTSKHTR